LRRRHLFEWNDAAWAPVALRETIVEALSRTLAWGRILHGAAAPFRAFLERTDAREVLDLCSGAGGPAVILADELVRAGVRPPRFILTDLHPQIASWERLRRRHPETLDFIREPVDATRIPHDLRRGRARVIVNALHHLPPELAGPVLRGASGDGPGVFVVEGFERNPLRFGAFAPAGIPALLVNPLLTDTHRLEKVALTWLTPAALAASVWDGVVSTLRVYTEEELRRMVAPVGDAFDWTYGTWDFPAFGRGYYFYGVARRQTGPRV
jgi:hypothetical protein